MQARGDRPEESNFARWIFRHVVNLELDLFIQVLNYIFKVRSEAFLSYKRIEKDDIFVDAVFCQSVKCSIKVSSIPCIVELHNSRHGLRDL